MQSSSVSCRSSSAACAADARDGLGQRLASSCRARRKLFDLPSEPPTHWASATESSRTIAGSGGRANRTTRNWICAVARRATSSRTRSARRL